ncbi:MAG: hypothetical protein NT074_05440 [Methanomicrobiales archaeon]|nr:hypothetical protein [Methanomicrobiales archaeon]
MSNYRKGRDAEYAARHVLQDRGFFVVRSAGSKTPFDLIAWNSENLIFLQVKRTTTLPSAKEVADRYQADLAGAREIPRPKRSHFQLWVMVPKKGWWRYEVLPSGIMEVPALVA